MEEHSEMPVKADKKNLDETTLHILKLILVGILCFIVIVFVFGVGVFVGQERAEFSLRWVENYRNNFGGPQRSVLGNMPMMQGFTNVHGIFGQVISIDGTDLAVRGQDNVEKTVVVSSQTIIRNSSSVIKLSDIKINDNIVIIGQPDAQGQIQAKFIRILPPGNITSIYINHFNI